MGLGDLAGIDALGREIWSSRYRAPGEAGLPDSWTRVAMAVASAEPAESREPWARRFREAMEDFRFLPGGRILASAGLAGHDTLFSCFVMGRLSDEAEALDRALAESEATLRAGGGIGIDLTPLGSGIVAALERWDAMCRRVSAAGRRRGAMMACLSIDHPQIEAFVEAKRGPTLSCFNLSVLVPDAFMGSLDHDPRARALWERLVRAAYDTAEPGVIFIDRVNRDNNLGYRETISAANPCAEQMLPPYGACLLGSINLGRLVDRPFELDAALDERALAQLAEVAVRFLDDAIDVSAFPLPRQEAEEKATRRIGLGVTGLADAFAFCGVEYGSVQSLALTRRWLGLIKRSAYRSSAALAGEKDAFPDYSAAILSRPNLSRLDPETRDLIGRHGLRNGCLTCIAPTGTISLLAGGASSGIE
ncbi:MAG: ribonucleotide reductase N-terminal alpha domain-containing protein, partial [Ignavibacteriales bacterium]